PASDRRGIAGIGRNVSGDAPDTGGNQWRLMADEHAEWPAGIFLRGVGAWRRNRERISVPATECPRISEVVLAEERAKGDRWYRQEYMCEFGEVEGAVFSRESIEAALRHDFEPLDL